jgi:hypothetical protein
MPLPPFDREGVVMPVAAPSHKLLSGLTGEKQKQSNLKRGER